MVGRDSKLNNIEDNKYNAKLFENIESIKRALQYYIKRNTELENELEYYKNAYENRVDEYFMEKRK